MERKQFMRRMQLSKLPAMRKLKERVSRYKRICNKNIVINGKALDGKNTDMD